jgi:hypothetical protein
MFLEKKYYFNKWSTWNKRISESSENFFKNFNCYPNLLFANEHTFSQINYITSIIPDLKLNFFKLNPGFKEVEIAYYISKKYEIRFAYDIDLPHKEFILVFDKNAIVISEELETTNQFHDLNRKTKERYPSVPSLPHFYNYVFLNMKE